MIDLKEIKNKILKKENFYFLVVILFIFGVDRYSKIEIINNFSDTSVYLNDFLNFDLIWNTGIGFGFFSTNSNIVYNTITLLITTVIIFLILIYFTSDTYDKTVFTLIIGGAISNLYDRIIFNAVPDFIDLHIDSFHWFTFNVADIFITIGIIAFILKGFLIKN